MNTDEKIESLKKSCQMLELIFNLICSKEWSGKDAEAIAQAKAYLQVLFNQSQDAIKELEPIDAKAAVTEEQKVEALE